MSPAVALAKNARLVFDAVETGPLMAGGGRRRMAIAIGTSALGHGAALVAAILLVQPLRVSTPIVVLPISLVSRPGAGSGGGDDAGIPPEPAATPPPAPLEPKPAPVETKAPAPLPAPRPKVVAKPRTKPAPEAPTPPATGGAPAGTDAAATGTEGGGGRAGGGGSGGAGGLGSSGASPAYGVNPQPPYPMVARRMGLEGTVLLRVVVAADGAPASVAVLQSSGHTVLDAAAVETVRGRWRFVPARRNGVAVEDSVQVPIRFHQTGG